MMLFPIIFLPIKDCIKMSKEIKKESKKTNTKKIIDINMSVNYQCPYYK